MSINILLNILQIFSYYSPLIKVAPASLVFMITFTKYTKFILGQDKSIERSSDLFQHIFMYMSNVDKQLKYLLKIKISSFEEMI